LMDLIRIRSYADRPEEVERIWWELVRPYVPISGTVVLSGAGPIWMYLEIVRLVQAFRPFVQLYVFDPKLRAAIYTQDIRRQLTLPEDVVATLAQTR